MPPKKSLGSKLHLKKLPGGACSCDKTSRADLLFNPYIFSRGRIVNDEASERSEVLQLKEGQSYNFNKKETENKKRRKEAAE